MILSKLGCFVIIFSTKEIFFYFGFRLNFKISVVFNIHCIWNNRKFYLYFYTFILIFKFFFTNFIVNFIIHSNSMSKLNLNLSNVFFTRYFIVFLCWLILIVIYNCNEFYYFPKSWKVFRFQQKRGETIKLLTLCQ